MTGPSEHPRAIEPSALSEADPSAWPATKPWRIGAAIGVLVLAIAAAWWSAQSGLGLRPVEAVMLGILVIAAGYWALEPIPAVATALVVIGLVVGCIGVPASLGAPWAIEAPRVKGWVQFIEPAGSSVMVLMFGSLMLALGAHRTGLDRMIGASVIRTAGGSPWKLIITLVGVSAFLSLWSSNTATAAMMLAVTRPIWDIGGVPVDDAPRRRRLAAGCVMAVALGSNVGGIASPVGTPPCAIVFTALDDIGAPITFLGWIVRGLPISIVLLIAGIIGIRWFMPPPTTGVDLSFGAGHHPHPLGPRWARIVVAVTFAITVTLWITSAWTGIPVAVSALVPAVVLPAAGVIRSVDFAHLEWDVLILILGGLVVGVGLDATGLASAVVGRIPVDQMHGLMIVGVMTVVAIVLSAFMSNTAVANLLTPIAMSIVVGYAKGDANRLTSLAIPLGFAVAIGSGISMMLPVATPANAIAHRTGAVSTGQFLKIGTLIGLVGVASIVGAAWFSLR